jgi:hypothetical protein
MFNGIGRKPPLRSEAATRFNGQAAMIASLVRAQLKRAKSSSRASLRPHRKAILGYACGMTEHLCAKFHFSDHAPEMVLLVVTELAGGSAGADDIVKMLITAQTAQDESFARAREVGWDDLGTPSPTGLEKLLHELRGNGTR